jgi:hypothetical protein
VRRLAAVFFFMAGMSALAACSPGAGDDSSAPSAGSRDNDPNTFRASGNPDHAYAGEWAVAANHCEDARKVWTVEPRRMAIQRVRFCVFDEDIYMADGKGDKPTTWSTGATCLADGKQSHDFLFFRVKDNLREMRVTFNDSNSVDLVRCPLKS